MKALNNVKTPSPKAEMTNLTICGEQSEKSTLSLLAYFS